MRLGEPDSSGRRAPIDTGEVVELQVDMVIKAAGQMPYEALVKGSGLPNRQGKILAGDDGKVRVDGTGGGTAVSPGLGAGDAGDRLAPVFAGGDCVNGGKEVVDAVQAGKEAAAAIFNYFGISVVK
jgi:glutamate synthase (NADPH/NADH) small chain